MISLVFDVVDYLLVDVVLFKFIIGVDLYVIVEWVF